MVRKALIYCMLLGAVAGGGLGAWLAWQHDTLVEFLIKEQSQVGRKPLLYIATFGLLIGAAFVKCAATVTRMTGQWLWMPALAGLLVSLAVTTLWVHVALTTVSLPLLAIVLGAFAVPAVIAAAFQIKMES